MDDFHTVKMKFGTMETVKGLRMYSVSNLKWVGEVYQGLKVI